MKNEKYTLSYLDYGENTEKNVENETQTLFDLVCGKKQGKSG
jgi:hypothetical protein